MAAAKPHFETHPQPLAYLLELIENRNLALPDFQRDFVWDAASTQDLLASIGSRFPAGTLLFLDQQGSKPALRPREFDEAPALEGKNPQMIVLDGQQRLTSLYQALYGRGDYLFFVDLNELLDSADLERAIGHTTQKRAEKEIGDLDQQANTLRLPLTVLRDPGFDEWLDEIIERLEAANGKEFMAKEHKKELRDVYKSHLKPLLEYSFPVVDLPRTTEIEAVCKIFETLNRTGVKLTVFELLVARFWPEGISLRSLWDEARDQYDILEDYEVDPYWLLQSICLRSGGETPSVQRQDVLKLNRDAIQGHWDAVVSGAAAALELLRDECGVLTAKWLPYSAVLVPMAAIWPKVDRLSGPAKGAARKKLKQYFWCAVFAGAFDASPNSAAVKHYQEIGTWLEGDAEPEVVRTIGSHFNGDILLEAKIGQRALYRGVMALTITHGALDFHNGKPLTPARLVDQKIDAHHVFPSKYLEEQLGQGEAGDPSSPQLILNRALIDKQTNRSIKKRAPSDYLQEIKEELGKDVVKVLDSHLLPSKPKGGLWSDDYEGFILERQELVLSELEHLTGKKIARSQGD